MYERKCEVQPLDEAALRAIPEVAQHADYLRVNVKYINARTGNYSRPHTHTRARAGN